ncbi:hypothetical protein Bbelb_234670 [Branchiostoma belcheri]|nr:hypothetical protein Bbelb_234670 [Branchiostoma belcheri]
MDKWKEAMEVFAAGEDCRGDCGNAAFRHHWLDVIPTVLLDYIHNIGHSQLYVTKGYGNSGQFVCHPVVINTRMTRDIGDVKNAVYSHQKSKNVGNVRAPMTSPAPDLMRLFDAPAREV